MTYRRGFIVTSHLYDFMYANPDTKIFVANYKKMSTPVTVTKNWLVFSYIRSGGYELYQNSDDTE